MIPPNYKLVVTVLLLVVVLWHINFCGLFNTKSCFYISSSCTDSIEFLDWFNSSIGTIDGTLTGTTTLGGSRPGSNSNEEVFHFSQTPGLEPHHQIQFSDINRTFKVFVFFSVWLALTHCLLAPLRWKGLGVCLPQEQFKE